MTRENWDVQEKEERRSIRRRGRATMINRIQRRKEGEMQQKEAGDSTCATRQQTRQKYMSILALPFDGEADCHGMVRSRPVSVHVGAAKPVGVRQHVLAGG